MVFMRCGQAVARRRFGATAAVRLDQPPRRLRMSAWARASVSAEAPRLKPRIGESRCFKCEWSRSMAWSQSPLPLGDSAERDSVADLHGRSVDDDAVDEEFDDRPPLLEGGPLQAPR